MRNRTVLAMSLGSAIFFACSTLPVFGPPLACLTGELARGIEDPLTILGDCAGATLAALIQAIEMQLGNPPSSDASAPVQLVTSGDRSSQQESSSRSAQGLAAVAGDAGVSPMEPSPVVTRVAYEAHLRRVLVRAKALQSAGQH